MDGLPPLEPLRAFVEAARRRSFRDAAAAMGLTPSAVSHRIKSLERWIGAPLFSRGVREIALTPAGRSLLKAADEGFGRIARAAGRLRSRDPRPLKVSALPLFVEAWLVPRLDRFHAAHPAVALEIETTNRVSDFERDPVDVAIRNLTRAPSGLAAAKLMDVRGVALATPRIAARLKRPEDLAGETLIHLTARPGGWDRWLGAAGVAGLRPKASLSFDAMPAALEAAARGAGVALGLDPVVRGSAAASRLVEPFPGLRFSESAYYVVHRKADAARPEIRAFVEWLSSEARAFARDRRWRR